MGSSPSRAPTSLSSVQHLTTGFDLGGRFRCAAVIDVSFDVAAGETLCLVGESAAASR